ncbi:MAG: heparinase II/III family protein [Paludibacter sp.]|nr:heparinase II/III family protein [Paludibacter sp.]
MKQKIFLLILAFSSLASINAQSFRKEVFELLDLKKPGLEKVNELVQAGKQQEAATALLDYYRNRSNVKHPSVNLKNVKISAEEQKWADDGLKHVFFVHKGYQPSYFYGDDINWEYWPVQDNELRWQLHRHKWWTPMGKAYRISGDEKYAREWTLQYIDWIKKNPLLNPTKEERAAMSSADLKKLENVRYAWRPLEVSNRLQDQTDQFMYFVSSKYFTPEFLSEFLVNYYLHAQHILGNYSDQGNHLLFEAQRMIYAGAFFPEFKAAEGWRKSGINILNQEIKTQVYDDGFQYELDPHYHLASINIFIQGIEIADVNGFRNDFPVSYLSTVEKMVMAVINYSFPNYQNPCFSDAKLDSKDEMVKNFKRWSKIFPENKQILYMATEGKKGELPSYLSNRLATSGFYIFRNGWKENATVMVLKAGPPAFWHNQPDNGTFELYINGRNFFPDAGSYVYAGSEEVNKERNWFRQTMVHKTLTLDNANLENTDSKCLLWETGAKVEKLVVENQSYSNLKHRRTVFFVDKSFFVIVDEAAGDATGNVAVHYQLSEGKVTTDNSKLSVQTLYDDNNNVVVKGFGAKGTSLIEEEGWVSYAYRQKSKRPAFAYELEKNNSEPARFITVIYPVGMDTPKIDAQFAVKDMEEKAVKVNLKINRKKYALQAQW